MCPFCDVLYCRPEPLLPLQHLIGCRTFRWNCEESFQFRLAYSPRCTKRRLNALDQHGGDGAQWLGRRRERSGSGPKRRSTRVTARNRGILRQPVGYFHGAPRSPSLGGRLGDGPPDLEPVVYADHPPQSSLRGQPRPARLLRRRRPRRNEVGWLPGSRPGRTRRTDRLRNGHRRRGPSAATLGNVHSAGVRVQSPQPRRGNSRRSRPGHLPDAAVLCLPARIVLHAGLLPDSSGRFHAAVGGPARSWRSGVPGRSRDGRPGADLDATRTGGQRAARRALDR